MPLLASAQDAALLSEVIVGIGSSADVVAKTQPRPPSQLLPGSKRWATTVSGTGGPVSAICSLFAERSIRGGINAISTPTVIAPAEVPRAIRRLLHFPRLGSPRFIDARSYLPLEGLGGFDLLQDDGHDRNRAGVSLRSSWLTSGRGNTRSQ